MSGMPQRPQGFTLIELMVAIALLAILAALSWRGIDGMARSIDHTKRYSDAVQSLQVGLAQWAADLDAVEAPIAGASLEWNGQVLRMTRRDPAGQGWCVVAWTQRDSAQGPQWLRWQSQALSDGMNLQRAWAQAVLWGQGQQAALQQRETAIAPLTSWQIYFFRGNSWTNPQSDAGKPQNDPNPNPNPNPSAPTPEGVRLILELPAEHPLAGRITRDWVRPTLGGNKS